MAAALAGQRFSACSERQAHVVRWLLLLGWLGLIVSLLMANFAAQPGLRHQLALRLEHLYERLPSGAPSG